jgi:hypothetical protein
MVDAAMQLGDINETIPFYYANNGTPPLRRKLKELAYAMGTERR